MRHALKITKPELNSTMNLKQKKRKGRERDAAEAGQPTEQVH
jgi:hypothetical protein